MFHSTTFGRWSLFQNAAIAFFLFLVPVSSGGHEHWGPWGKEGHYVLASSSPTSTYSESPHFITKATTLPFSLLIIFFQKVISPADGATCNFYPTCSSYARQALEKHGLIVGLAMASERINRDHSSSGYELIYKFGKYYLYDPLEYNDFWFHPKQGKER